jgi:hypothetical protein
MNHPEKPSGKGSAWVFSEIPKGTPCLVCRRPITGEGVSFLPKNANSKTPTRYAHRDCKRKAKL